MSTSLGPVSVLISTERLAKRVVELGQTISRDYEGREIVLVSVLKGSFVFTADLIRAIDSPVRVEFLGVRSYGDQTTSSGVVELTLDLGKPIAGADVLVVEDIVDTGLTLAYLTHQLLARGPRSVKVCALLHKPSRMREAVTIDYLGFGIDDVFVVGYGLDHAESYRNLPYVGVLDAEAGGPPA